MYHIYMYVCNKIYSSWCWPVHWQPNLIYEDNDATKVLQFNLWDQILHHWSQRVRLMAKKNITWYVECGTPPSMPVASARFSLVFPHPHRPAWKSRLTWSLSKTQLCGWCLCIPNPTKVAPSRMKIHFWKIWEDVSWNPVSLLQGKNSWNP